MRAGGRPCPPLGAHLRGEVVCNLPRLPGYGRRNQVAIPLDNPPPRAARSTGPTENTTIESLPVQVKASRTRLSRGGRYHLLMAFAPRRRGGADRRFGLFDTPVIHRSPHDTGSPDSALVGRPGRPCRACSRRSPHLLVRRRKRQSLSSMPSRRI